MVVPSNPFTSRQENLSAAALTFPSLLARPPPTLPIYSLLSPPPFSLTPSGHVRPLSTDIYIRQADMTIQLASVTDATRQISCQKIHLINTMRCLPHNPEHSQSHRRSNMSQGCHLISHSHAKPSSDPTHPSGWTSCSKLKCHGSLYTVWPTTGTLPVALAG
jgi:hypothetical protein